MGKVLGATTLGLAVVLLGSVPLVVAETLSVQLTGSDGKPVPFAVLTLPGVESAPAPPLQGASVDQRERRFLPHVSAISPGTEVNFPNSDDTRHHVYSFSEGNSFELKLFRANDAPPVAFNNPGIVTLGCNIHDSMKAYLYVSTDATAVVSDARGRATLSWDGAQPATVLQVWHPQLDAAMAVPLAAPPGATLAVDLPLAWEDPQVSKSNAELESLLKRFARDANQLPQ
ncbi:methylamine utilization protein [Haliea sp. E1-2-M8]|uniref:methylamine utilization protein n=1 Tax=Haliea sp. E1-2-M8 TaxID=3064706 RepID=UPI00271FD873|nr:methylamine utilization protein [Haliea sp. E1-2-M8]MDO8863307.1 methylamine utilization protein [Haliea sp. E1-2-M8]